MNHVAALTLTDAIQTFWFSSTARASYRPEGVAGMALWTSAVSTRHRVLHMLGSSRIGIAIRPTEAANASRASDDVELDAGVRLEFGAKQVEKRGW
jgi:hypothetical protein